MYNSIDFTIILSKVEKVKGKELHFYILVYKPFTRRPVT